MNKENYIEAIRAVKETIKLNNELIEKIKIDYIEEK